MHLENYEQLVQSVDEAQLVLVGLGEEWVMTEEMIMEDLADKNKCLYEMFQAAKKEERFYKVLSVLTAYYYKNYIPAKLEKAYKNMYDLLEGKNYFIVSLTVDPYLNTIGFKKDRYVNPCGTYEKMQCEDGCNMYLVSSDQLLEEVNAILNDDRNMECGSEKIKRLLEQCLIVLDRHHCKQCEAPMSFNLLDTKIYREEGYLDCWQIYMKWLQGTLNKKLCVIESGVGMQLPSVIRWPFEKTVFYNQKAKMFRIHKMFYQVNEEVAERAYGCECHSVSLFNEKKVEA